MLPVMALLAANFRDFTGSPAMTSGDMSRRLHFQLADGVEAQPAMAGDITDGSTAAGGGTQEAGLAAA